MSKKLTPILIGLFLFPWGIQCLVDNFLPIYVASLPFSTEKTIGEISAIGAIVTMISQLVWTSFAGKARDKSRVLALSLILLTVFALLFLLPMTKALLILLTVLFYSCYMTHQPLIDTIAAEKHSETARSFGWFRSFASLGYAVFGLFYTFLPSEPPSLFFIYVAVLATLAAVLSLQIKAPSIAAKESSGPSGPYMNPDFIRFLIYSFLLFLCSRMVVAFFSVYYSTDMGLGGSVSVFSLLISIATIVEWLLMLVLGKKIVRTDARWIFLLTALMGVFKALVIFTVRHTLLMFVIILFHAGFFALLWASSTPYIRRIVPANGLTAAQGVWTVVTSGIAPFVGSYIGGLFAEHFGLRMLFLLTAALFLLLALLTLLLIKKTSLSE